MLRAVCFLWPVSIIDHILSHHKYAAAAGLVNKLLAHVPHVIAVLLGHINVVYTSPPAVS